MMEPEQAARQWLTRAEREEDVFFRFASLWFAFNALYSAHHDGIKGERRVIKDFVYSSVKRSQAGRILQGCGEAIDFFANRPIRDVLGRGTDTAEDAARLRQIDNTRPLPRLVALVMVLYRVRCNLFHGNKAYWREADDAILRQAANVMERVLKTYLAER